MAIPRIMIAGTHSGVGKTTLASGLMAALAERHAIQGYKVGPDFIDPSYHKLATGRPSRNLDRWLLGERLPEIFWQSAEGYWVVVEGVMGLFDGMRGTPGFGSSADIAKQIKTPVLLIVDAASMAQSAAALVYGFQHYDPEVQLCGVIFNRVRSMAQEQMLREALAQINIPVLGCVPEEKHFRLPERHLGLIPVDEQELRQEYLAELIQFLQQHVDIAAIESIMIQSGSALDSDRLVSVPRKSKVPRRGLRKGQSQFSDREDQVVRLGIAQDEAFLFYYQDALELLAKKGFELVPFSPLHDAALPSQLDAVFIGGGFPELFLPQLSTNLEFISSLKAFAHSGKPIYAECGGYMYLGEDVLDFKEQSFSMVGIIPISSQMTSSLQGMGYREGMFAHDNFLGSAGSIVHGHEFHYSKVVYHGECRPLFHLRKGGKLLRADGFAEENIAASYLHLHFAGQPELLEHWFRELRGEKDTSRR